MENSNELIIPKVGVGLLLLNSNSILLGKRKGSHGAGEYGGPGGHLDPGESFEECIQRELAEEAGLELTIKNLGFLCVTNLRKYLPKHYVDIGMIAEWNSGEPKVIEPDKLENWGWYDLNKLPNPLFGNIENYIDSKHSGKTYYEF